MNMFQKVSEVFKHIKDTDFKTITLVNDNYVYLNSLVSYFDFVEKSTYDIISFTDSTEIFYHLQMNVVSIKKEVFHIYNNVIHEYTNKKNTDYHALYLEFLREINNLFQNKGIFCKTAYIESVYKKNIYLTNSDHYYFLLEKNILPIIDLKVLDNLNEEYDNKSFVFKKIPYDFDINIYKSYDDLKEYDDDFLKVHFIDHGQYECRRYKEHETILPSIIYNKLNKIKLIKYFDFPDDFNFYSYKQRNKDLNDLNKLDLKKHWMNYGVFENRDYK